MKIKPCFFVIMAIATGLLTRIPVAAAQDNELATLRTQLEAALKRIEALEQQQQSQQESQDRAVDAIAQTRANVGEWVGRFQWRGDLRYRNENIDQQHSVNRNRDRLRLRAGFLARVNDTVRVEMQASSAIAFDARSSNQDLTDASSRKALDLDTAYAEWAPNDHWRATFGKIRYPWVRTTSFFFDQDINPEGGALNWQQGASGVFASVFYLNLMERSSAADSSLAGAQVGWRGDLAEGTRLTLAGAYFEHNSVRGYDAYFERNPANAFGNSVTTNASICRHTGITTCLANDYSIAQVIAELGTSVAGHPLTVYVDAARNTAAEGFGSTPDGLDTAYAAGFLYGRVSGAHSWEVGYLYQVVEKDSLFSQWIDSDFGGGATDHRGYAIRFGYGFARNFRLNGTYMINKNNVDVPANVSGVGQVFERDYRRLQIDLNTSF